MKPLKRFGQNYLTDRNIINKIIEEFSPKEGENILEIGPGKGALTEYLNASGANVFAVEIDKRVIDDLSEKFKAVKFIRADFLKMDLSQLSTKSLRIIGNIPYNITSPILFKLFDNFNIIEDAVLMMQDEVAKRIIAGPRTKDYGILSVLTSFYAETKYCFKISPNVFYPKPKVNSAVVHLRFKKELPYNDHKFLHSVVKASFGKRRKTLKNSLKNSIFADCDFTKISSALTRRAEEYRLADFLHLAAELRELIDD